METARSRPRARLGLSPAARRLAITRRYVGTPFPHNRKLADLGLHCYLKMLLKDNFIHADLVGGC